MTTKIHPFWNLYFNGLGMAIAERLEPNRSERAHSYRSRPTGEDIFDPCASCGAFAKPRFPNANCMARMQ